MIDYRYRWDRFVLLASESDDVILLLFLVWVDMYVYTAMKENFIIRKKK
jgi:hypothetical protein